MNLANKTFSQSDFYDQNKSYDDEIMRMGNEDLGSFNGNPNNQSEDEINRMNNDDLGSYNGNIHNNSNDEIARMDNSYRSVEVDEVQSSHKEEFGFETPRE